MRRKTQGLRVLLTADAVGGVWTYAQDLAAGLAAKGVRVTIAVLGPPPLERPDLPAGVDMVITGLPLDWEEVEPAALDAAGRALAELAKQGDVDLVHLNSPILAAGAAFDGAVVGGCHSCVATWWDAVRGDRPLPPEFSWRTDRLREGYRTCAALIAPSQSFADQTTRRYDVAPRVVWNGRAPPPPRVADVRRRAVAITAGRLWDEAKGVAALDAAAGMMQRRIEAAGPAESPSGHSGASFAHLKLLGRLTSAEVADLLADSAVFVSPARYEPFGLAVLEAAQAGCALVLSDLPVFRELWDGAAVFVDAADEVLLARTLDGLLDDPVEARRLGGLARARAERFTADAMIAETLAVYLTVLSQTGRSEVAA